MSWTSSSRARRCATAVAVLVCAGAASGAPAGAATAHHAKPASLKLSAPLPKGALTRGKAIAVKVKVTNASHAAIAGASARVSASKGIAAALSHAKRGTLKLGTIKPRKHKTVTLRLTPGAAAAAASSATIAVKAKRGVRTSLKLKLKLAAAAPTPTPTPTPTPAPQGLSGRYFFSTQLIGATTYMYGVYFVDGQWAYRGVPAGGLPACSARTAPNQTDDGCVPYTYDPSTGALTVDGVAGSLVGDVFKLDGTGYAEAVPPAAGSRYDVSARSINGAGICGISCSFVTHDLTLTGDGQFGLITTVSGSTPDSQFAALPPNQHGTYAIDQRGRVTFSYADGSVQTDTISIMQNDAGAADPSYAFILDSTIYWGPTSGV